MPEYFWNVVNISATLLTAIGGAWLTMLVFRGGKKADAANRRLEKVYGPLFEIIEPYLFCKMPRAQCADLVNRIDTIVSNGGYLLDPDLKDMIRFFRRSSDCSPKQYKEYQYRALRLYSDTPDFYLEYWFQICQHINRTYDELCLICSYPLRSRGYRLGHKQYASALRTNLAWIRFLAPAIIWFIVMCLMLFLSMNTK